MCGIGGIVQLDGAAIERMTLERMQNAMFHRGPDENGTYVDATRHPDTGWRVGLVSRRLSIIDLETGSQPMTNADASVHIAYNGEVYNYKDLRTELEVGGRTFSTSSDTEVVLQAYEEFGIDAVSRLEGMFAFAIWDKRLGRVLLARDGMGIKPLYYNLSPGRLVFASELKVLLASKVIAPTIDPDALSDYLFFEFIPAPRSAILGVKKLPPGHRFVLQRSGQTCERYWTPQFTTRRRKEQEWIEAVQGSLSEAVRSQLVSDVPVGVLLSGGIDSSSVLALASSGEREPMKTFSIGFDDPQMSELPHARIMAERCGTEHFEMVVDSDRLLATLPSLWRFMDEPHADASDIPTFLVSQLASREVKVVLSGDGGDELFGGYRTYQAWKVAACYRMLPAPMRRLAARLITGLRSSSEHDSAVFKLKKFVRGVEFAPEYANSVWWGAYLPEEKRQLLAADVWQNLTDPSSSGAIAAYGGDTKDLEALDRIFYLDLKLYLQDNLLVKVDRMSMANSLEVRVPFLDRSVVNLACQIPHGLKIKGMQTKYLLRKAMAPYLPEAIRDRRKQGFNLPLGKWLRCGLRELIEDTLRSEHGVAATFFNSRYLSRLLDEHASGVRNHRQLLWPVLVFFAWCEEHL